MSFNVFFKAFIISSFKKTKMILMVASPVAFFLIKDSTFFAAAKGYGGKKPWVLHASERKTELFGIPFNRISGKMKERQDISCLSPQKLNT